MNSSADVKRGAVSIRAKRVKASLQGQEGFVVGWRVSESADLTDEVTTQLTVLT
jgi:hypothetical protein